MEYNNKHSSYGNKYVIYENDLKFRESRNLDLNKIVKCKKYIKKFSPRIKLGFNRRYDPGHYYLKKSIAKGNRITLSTFQNDPDFIDYFETKEFNDILTYWH